MHSVADCDVHRVSNAETTNSIHSHTDGQSQSMKTLKARGKDNPANDKGATKLMYQDTNTRMCRYFVLSDPDITVNSYSTSQFYELPAANIL